MSASFQYDATGRRTNKTAGTGATSFLNDGANVIQENSGAANILIGGTDEFFQRNDANGSVGPITDAVGSVLALVDSTGSLQTQYTYDPFGNTGSSGALSGNATQYAGRENDGTGLYYYRARYYSPALQRFISEDPLGLAGGMNLYAYAGNNPVSFIDPFGTDKRRKGDGPGGPGSGGGGGNRPGRSGGGGSNGGGNGPGADGPGGLPDLLPGLKEAINEMEQRLFTYYQIATMFAGPMGEGFEGEAMAEGLGAGAAEEGAFKYGSTPEGRPFTRHYGTETGPVRNIPGSILDNTIKTAECPRPRWHNHLLRSRQRCYRRNWRWRFDCERP
jgi:RHS repeat-associated protein